MPKTEEQCQQIREDTRNRILKKSSLYFARNGFGDTKIGDLARHIGIGQGTIYLYFKSKEELFEEIRKSAENQDEIKRLKMLAKLLDFWPLQRMKRFLITRQESFLRSFMLYYRELRQHCNKKKMY